MMTTHIGADMTTFAWVLVLWIGGGYGGAASVPNIATEGDCHYAAHQIFNEWKAKGVNVGNDLYTCTKYKVAK